MKVETKGHTTIIKHTQDDLSAFLTNLTQEHKAFEKQNLIIDITHNGPVSVKEINAFVPLSNTHKKGKRSFAIVAADFDFNKSPAKLTIVPTRLEAQDIIEMEEIERDLGF